MKIKFIILFILSYSISYCEDDSFITQYEYGKMLYNKPRGISCAKCHGKDAKGKQIATFTHIHNKKSYKCTIKSPNITNVDFDTFQAVLDPNIEKPKKKFDKTNICKKLIYGHVMPTYFLTPQELKSIYYYLINKKKYQE